MSLRALIQDKGFAGSCRRFLAVWVAKAAPEAGASLVEMALMLPFLGLLLLGVIDFGRAYYMSIEVQNAAEAGALYGSQNLGDTAGMIATAKADAPDIPSSTWTSGYPQANSGYECSNGSSQQSTPPTTCGTYNVVQYAQVITNVTYTTWFPLWIIPGLPASIPLQGSATMRQRQ